MKMDELKKKGLVASDLIKVTGRKPPDLIREMGFCVHCLWDKLD